MKTTLIVLALLALVACDSPPKRSADNMVIISKEEMQTGNDVRYGIWCYGSKLTDLYLISADRSFDVGDHVKLIKKQENQ